VSHNQQHETKSPANRQI